MTVDKAAVTAIKKSNVNLHIFLFVTSSKGNFSENETISICLGCGWFAICPGIIYQSFKKVSNNSD